jgi:hypothetical protein
MFSHPLAREVAVVVAVKVAIVLTAGFLVFGPRQRARIDDASVTERLVHPPATGLGPATSIGPHP